MVNMNADVSVGKLVAAFGVKGELVLLHALGGKTDLKGVKVLFVEKQRGSTIPYFLESARAKSADETWVKFEDVNSREAAALLLQKQVWMTDEDFNRHVKPNATIALLGYEVWEQGKKIGIISEIIEQPHQVLCAVMVEGKEALIPLNESTLAGIDRRKKTVSVNLPDGLLDIYLQ
jgi:16S rRNA processing protein RimM